MGLSLLSWTVKRVASSSPAGATGTIVIPVGGPAGTQWWRVEQIAISCTSSTETAFFAYDRPAPWTGMVPCQATRVGNATVDDQATPITIMPGDQLTLVWTGCSEGSVARARVQIAVFSGTPGTPTPLSV